MVQFGHKDIHIYIGGTAHNFLRLYSSNRGLIVTLGLFITCPSNAPSIYTL